MKYASHLVVALPLLAFSAVFAGCGPSGPATYPVSGTVTFNGEQIPNDHNGYIVFVPDNKSIGPVSSQIIDGKYSLRAQEGGQTVQVWASRFVEPRNEVMGMTPKVQYIPEEFNAKTKLTADVKPIDNNEFNFPREVKN
jgi:hypothetical protein